MAQITIRTARHGDENQLAQVHIQSWQETYRGFVPQDYLDSLPLELNERIEMWKRILANPQRWTWVAESAEGIVGFSLFGLPRDPNRNGFIELGAIYLLSSEKGKGVGFSLLSAGFNKMRDLGYKRAYCWVLENNPSIKFYERSGAKYSSQIKEDEIGGKKFNELAYDWDSLDIGDYNWKPLSVNEVKAVFKNFKSPWWIAGGWAIDLFLQKETRPHDDIDVLIQRSDQLEIQNLLIDWDLWAADPPGTLKPWRKGEFLGKGIQDIWGRKTPTDPWQIQFMLFDTENNNWIFKRNEKIRKSLASITMKTKDGLCFLAPEVQLLYKSKSLREKDEKDFENTLPAMSKEQTGWLQKALSTVYNDNHKWLDQLNFENFHLIRDEKTHSAYAKNANDYSQDWLSQPEPTDIYKLIQEFFIPSGLTADIGCGNGRDANWMTQNGFQVFGFDSSDELIKLGSSLFPEVKFDKATLPDLKEINIKYDNVFCETVIMHLPKNQIASAIQNLKRILKPEGILYLSWRVTECQDSRHADGRLYSAFSPDFIRNQFDPNNILFFEDKISLSSGKRVCRLIWKNN